MRHLKDPMQAAAYRTQRREAPEDLWQPLYDRVNLPVSLTGSINFYSSPKGQSATLIRGTSASSVVKTLRDTNMESANVVPTKLYKFVGINIAFVHSSKSAATNAADRALVRDGGYIRLRIVDKDLLILPLLCIPELNPISAVSTTATASTIFGEVGGGRASMYKFPVPITLQPYETFTVALEFDGTSTLSNTLDLYMVLQAYMRRPT